MHDEKVRGKFERRNVVEIIRKKKDGKIKREGEIKKERKIKMGKDQMNKRVGRKTKALRTYGPTNRPTKQRTDTCSYDTVQANRVYGRTIGGKILSRAL